MKIYTKILTGMGVGAIVGLTLGPKSPLLDADLYKIDDASKITLQTDPDDPASALPIPKAPKAENKVKLELRAKEIRTAQLEDKQGKACTVPVMARVEFDFSRRLALLDKTGALRERLGNPKAGETVEAWLPIEHTALDGGGFVTTPEPISGIGDTVIAWLSPIGDLFMRLIKMVIVPLVFASLLVGVAGLGDIRKLGRLGGKTLGLYLFTTATAVSIGLMLAHVIKPGNFVAEEDRAALTAQFEGDASGRVDAAAEAPSAVDNVLAIIPENPVESMTSGNMLQIIFFAVLFGIALTLLKEERSRQVISFFDTVQNAMIVIIHIVMAVAPYGVAALIAKVVGMSGVSVLKALVVYSLTVILGLAILASALYAGLVRFFSGVKWLQFMRAARPAQLIAFSTSSSSATLPITLECAEQNLGISKSVSSFVIPLGSTVNMDGTALYQGVAAIFIAQVFQVDLTVGDQLGIVLAATMASIGAAGVPGAGMITLAMVLTAAGIPAVGVALILGVDRLLDMFRSAVNVTGDLAVATVMAATEGENPRVLSPDEDEKDPNRGFEGRLEKTPHAVAPPPDEDESPADSDA